MADVLLVAVSGAVACISASIAGVMVWRGRTPAKPTPQQRAARAPRGPRRTPKELLDLQKARYIAHLRETDPAAYDTYMQQLLGIRKDAPDPIGMVAGTMRGLREAGLIPDDEPGRAGEPEGSRIAEKLIEAVGPSMGPVLAELISSRQQGQPAASTSPVAPTAAPASAPQTAPAAPPAPAGPIPERPPLDAEPPMDFLSRMVVAGLDGKTPEQAALWFNNRTEQQARALVEALRQCPDSTLPAYIQHIGSTEDGGAPYLAWWLARPERWPWFVAGVRALRQIAA